MKTQWEELQIGDILQHEDGWYDRTPNFQMLISLKPILWLDLIRSRSTSNEEIYSDNSMPKGTMSLTGWSILQEAAKYE